MYILLIEERNIKEKYFIKSNLYLTLSDLRKDPWELSDNKHTHPTKYGVKT